ncbi:MAG TPA: hypothetical protein VJW51_09275 [Candidatus Acidoferrales bacterium]|nr:hypothetical protein [Candidatus Acidoferrales bacterium]
MSTRRLLFHPQLLLAVAAVVFLTLSAGSDVGSAQKAAAPRMGHVLDWSSRHVLYPQGTSLRALMLSERDPRAYWNYLRIMQAVNLVAGPIGRRPPVRPVRPVRQHPDWSVSLGAAGTAPSMFPAKFSFDVNAAPDCANDYLVYAINASPSPTQANIVAFNNLYSGSGTPFCVGQLAPTVIWAYQVSNVALPTSPIISLDGTKVAFVDGASDAVFHVLNPSAGAVGGTVGAPLTPTAAQDITVTLTGATTDSLSPPFVDYYNDVAYVGSDSGHVFKITGVFKGTPALAGSPWPRTSGSAKLTAPVIDFSTGEIFLGSSDGNLYGYTRGGAEFYPLTIGNNTAFGGIVDAPVVDAVNGLLYVGTGDSAILATSAAISQVSTSSFTIVQTASIGKGAIAPIHAGAFNNAYFNSPMNGMTGTTEWFYYACGVTASPLSHPQLWQVSFDSTRLMNSSATALPGIGLSLHNGEVCSPLTEFQNGVDRLFLGLLTTQVVEFFDISTSTTPTLGAPGQVAEAGGTSGIIVDNVSMVNQASSIYFTTLASSANCGGNFCAVKLTQGGLQ